MESPTGLIPEELMNAGMKKQALDFLRAQPWTGGFKVQVLYGWGQVVGNTITLADAMSIHASGWK